MELYNRSKRFPIQKRKLKQTATTAIAPFNVIKGSQINSHATIDLTVEDQETTRTSELVSECVNPQPDIQGGYE
jgi:hypothetical protein